MVYRRRRTFRKTKRRVRRPAGLIGRNVGNRLIQPGYLNGQVYRFKRKYLSTVQVIMDTFHTETHGAFVHKLSDLQGNAEFTALFDKYRIAGIQAKFIPRTNVLALNNLSSTLPEIPPLLTVIDYDDATAVDNTALVQFENCQVHSEFKPFTLYYKPMIAVAAYNGTFTGYGSSRKMWIDAASPSVEYYGLKWATLPYATSANTPNDPAWDVIFTYYIECKYPR